MWCILGCRYPSTAALLLLSSEENQASKQKQTPNPKQTFPLPHSELSSVPLAGEAESVHSKSEVTLSTEHSSVFYFNHGDRSFEIKGWNLTSKLLRNK